MKSFLVLVNLLALVPLLVVSNEVESLEKYTSKTSLYCEDLNPQKNIDIEQLMGLWYGAEVITHHDEGESFETTYDSCVVLHLAEVTNELDSDYNYEYDDSTNTNRNNERHHNNKERERERERDRSIIQHNYRGANRFLRLIWDERGKTLEYTLRFNNTRRGFWLSSGPQKGTMLELPYNQFTGTVQVMKAVGNHLVLTFCQTLPRSQLFSIVLTRKPHILARDDVQSVRGLLRRRGLNVQTVRKVCSNSSTLLQTSILTIISLAIASLLSRKF
ncbi:unnamed protein product [Diamesa serratosioi]